MYTSHRLNTLVPVCLSTVYDEHLEFTCTPLLAVDICDLLSAERPIRRRGCQFQRKLVGVSDVLTYFLIPSANSILHILQPFYIYIWIERKFIYFSKFYL